MEPITKSSQREYFLPGILPSVVGVLAIALLAIALWTPDAGAILARGDAVTDPAAILRNALPIDNKPIRKVQASVEDMGKHIRGKRWSVLKQDVRDANYILAARGADILAGVPDERSAEGQALLENIRAALAGLDRAVEAKDKEQIRVKRQETLDGITHLEELMVVGFPFTIPPEYAALPVLKGRATVEIETTRGDLTVVVDGYSAPLNAGNFVDLVHRGFYDGLPFIRGEDNFVVQTGDPPGPEEGFIDPDTGRYRAIPLEIRLREEEEPTYGHTLEELGIYLPDLALPFNAFGAVALARPDTDPNGGSSQFFFFKFDNELTPPGFNLMDGRYSVFGYLVRGQEVLDALTDRDRIVSAKVTRGLDNLSLPA